MSSSESQELIVVLDSAALIAGTDNLFSLGGIVNTETGESLYLQSSQPKVTFYSIPEVFHEIRDPRARARLALLQDSVVLRTPSSEAVAETIDFSKRTGDFAVLSVTDLKVIALTRMLEREANGDKFLKTAPAQRRASEIRIGRTIPFDVLDQLEAENAEDRISGNEPNSNETSESSGGDWKVVAKTYTKPVTQKVKPKKKRVENKGKESLQKNKKSADWQEAQKKGDGNVLNEPLHDKKSADLQEARRKGDGNVLNEPHHEPMVIEEKQLVREQNENGKSVSTNQPRRGRRYRRRKRKPVKIGDAPSAELNEKHGAEAEVSHVKVEVHPCVVEHTSKSSAELGTEENDAQISGSDETEDSDEDGSEWINEVNLEKHLARDRGQEMDLEEGRNKVACVTTDFAMQNTMLQMGLKLLSVDGRRSIQKIKHFALRCHSCGLVTTELERKFCRNCGNSCMHRVAYKIDKNGVARAYLNPKKKASLRGTKYPIPMPRGGRHNKDLILREDQIDPVKQRRLQKQRERLNVDVLDPSNFYNAGAKFNPYNKPVIVGYGRRNPNEVRGSSRGSR